jgi:hypothetical protein
MPFGKRAVPPKEPEPEDDNCPHCRGAGAIRGRGQRKVCLACKGTGKKPEVAQEPAGEEPDGKAPDAQELGPQEPGPQEPGSQEPGPQEPGPQEPETQEADTKLPEA